MKRKVDAKTYVEQARDVHIHEAEPRASLPSNIPVTKGFIGREDDLNALRKAKQNGKTSFVLHGTGGVGKTELALKFIEEIKGEFQAHIRVDMQGLANALSPHDAMLEIIRAFRPDVPSLPPDQIESLYVSLLNQHKTLLFFDNARDRAQVEPLNQKQAFVVITSRATFNVTGGYGKEVEQMSPQDAMDLLYSIAEEERFDGKADELAHITGYLPMALLPLASILAEDKTIKVARLIEKYSNRKERLRLSDPNRKNLSVEASFDLSYECLSNELKERWRKLAVFPADFDLEVLKILWEDVNARESRSALVKSNLVIFDEESERSHLHDLARDYTGEKLNDEELFRAEKLHTIYYGMLLVNLGTVSSENLAIFDLERTNIEMGFARMKNKVHLSDEYASICDYYTDYASAILILRLHPREFIKWMETGLSASRKIGDQQGEGNHLGNLGHAYDGLGEYRKAIEYYEQALKIAGEISDQRGKCSRLGNLGVAYKNLREHQEAIKYYEQALAIAREIGDLRREGMWLGNLGSSYSDLSEWEKTIEYYERALAIAREIGDRHQESVWLGNLGNAYLNLDDPQKAIEYNEEALAIAREIGDQLGEGYRLGNLGTAYAGLGEKDKAIGLLEEGIRIFEEIESPTAETLRQILVKVK